MTEYEQYLQNFNRGQGAEASQGAETGYQSYLKGYEHNEKLTALKEEQALQAEASPVQLADPTSPVNLGKNMPLSLGITDRLSTATTLGLGDELGAGVNAGIDQIANTFGFDWGQGTMGDESFSQSYDRRVKSTRDRQEGFRQENPKTSLAVDVLGSLPATIATAGAAHPLVTQTALGATSGFGYGEGLGDSLQRAGEGGLLSFGLSSMGFAMQRPATQRVIAATADKALQAEKKLLSQRSTINNLKKKIYKSGERVPRSVKAESKAIDRRLAETQKAIGDSMVAPLDTVATSSVGSRLASGAKNLTSGIPMPSKAPNLLSQSFGTAGRLPDVSDTINDALNASLFKQGEL